MGVVKIFECRCLIGEAVTGFISVGSKRGGPALGRGHDTDSDERNALDLMMRRITEHRGGKI